ncbi:MAG: FecR family protein, partial [Candidatus Sulfotelmatobacter sp.]
MYKPRLHAMVTVMMALACALLALPAAADSQVRIVRLSDVQGRVQINKNSGFGFENAFTNLPVTQGIQLRTGANGRAEVEFEDGSTLRVTPNTTVAFSKLAVNDAGKHVSTVDLVDGRAYVNWLGKSGDELTLNFSRERLELSQPAHLRVASSADRAEVASFKNDVEVSSPSGTVKVEKKKMVDFEVDDNDKSTAAKNVESDPYDDWDKQSIEYHDQYSKNNSTLNGYGTSDLNYYGSYNNVPGFGTMWQPYFTGAGWNPFMDGAWSWYPGMGYMWASAYPWGWMPYYCGNWANAPGFGWGWQPGTCIGSGWHGGIHYVGAVQGFRPPVAPTGTVSTVVVGKGGAVLTNAPVMHTVVSKGSAGLGIPRGSYGDLHHLNTQVAKTGSVELHAAPQFAATSPRPGSGFGGQA